MDAPLLLITPEAQAKVAAAAKSAGHPDARLRVAMAGRRGAGFAYDLSLVPPDRVDPADLVVETPHGVVDTTDHASGTNPYYQPAKK